MSESLTLRRARTRRARIVADFERRERQRAIEAERDEIIAKLSGIVQRLADNGKSKEPSIFVALRGWWRLCRVSTAPALSCTGGDRG